MNKLTKSSLSLVAIGLLSSSAFASSGIQDTGFLKKEKEVAPVEQASSVEQSPKEKFFNIEAGYLFNQYEPKYDNKGTTKKDFNNSGTFGFGLGMMANKNLLVDGTLSYIPETKYDFDSGSDKYRSKVKTAKLMLNGTFLIDTPMENVSPYITAGVGSAYNKATIDTHKDSSLNKHYSKSEFKFAYQAGLGVSYKLQNDSRVNLGYRFADNGEVYKASGVKSDRLQSHSVMLGVQLPF